MNIFTKISRELLFFGLVIVLVTLPWAKSLTSVGMGIAGGISFVYGIYKFKEIKREEWALILPFVLLFVFGAISFVYSENTEVAAAKIFLKLPILLLPFSLVLFKTFNRNRKYWLLGLFVFVVFTNGLLSTINYYNHFSEYNSLILKAKPIPILGKIHHIQFSVFNALSVFFGVYLFLKLKGKSWRYLFLVVAILNFIMLHILTARTGLLSFYATAVIILAVYAFTKDRLKGFLGLGALGLLLVVFYFSSTSFRNRIYDTKKDVQTYLNGTYPNHYSNTQRIMALETGFSLLQKNPLIGVGIGDVKHEMLKEYELNESPLLLETRKKPHNQFMESSLQFGLLGFVFLLFIFVVPLRQKRGYLMMVFLSVFFVSMQFESLLERQSSLYLFLMLYFALASGYEKKKEITS